MPRPSLGVNVQLEPCPPSRVRIVSLGVRVPVYYGVMLVLASVCVADWIISAYIYGRLSFYFPSVGLFASFMKQLGFSNGLFCRGKTAHYREIPRNTIREPQWKSSVSAADG